MGPLKTISLSSDMRDFAASASTFLKECVWSMGGAGDDEDERVAILQEALCCAMRGGVERMCQPLFFIVPFSSGAAAPPAPSAALAGARDTQSRRSRLHSLEQAQ